MAGIDDYQFYTNLKDKDSPFWQKLDKAPNEDENAHLNYNYERPSNFPRQLGLVQAGSEPSLKSSSLNPNSDYLETPKDLSLEKYGEVSFTLISVCAENLLSHPFIVLRRQCQVNVSSQRYHLQPFTLIPALIHMQSHQGLSALWKGLGSVLTVRGVTLAMEDFLSKFTPWPKEISPHSSLKTIGQHLLLKCSALALITPFYSASLVETVQSEITSERPGVLDVFKEGIFRLVSFTKPQTSRMLPVWLLIVPTVVHGVLQYVIGNIVSTLTSKYLRRLKKQNKKGAISKDTSMSDSSIRLQSAFIGHLAADVVLYPLETILHRLHLQGTRTIIDSLDIGYEVKPMLTRYEGFYDCVATTARQEGFLGFFKGYGALCLQYAIYGAVLKFAHVIIRELTLLLVPNKPKAKKEERIAPLAAGAPYSNIQSGTSSLHTTPLHSARSRHGGNSGNHFQQMESRLYHTGSVELGDLSYNDRDAYPFNNKYSTSSDHLDFKAELQKHKVNLESALENE